MTGPKHYAAAEGYVDAAVAFHDADRPEAADFFLRLADVHAISPWRARPR